MEYASASSAQHSVIASWALRGRREEDPSALHVSLWEGMEMTSTPTQYAEVQQGLLPALLDLEIE